MADADHHGGIDAGSFATFAEQLDKYVRHRLIPAEPEVIAGDSIPEPILAEMRDMGLFGLTIPPEYGGAGMNVAQYVEAVRLLAYGLPAFRSVISINVGIVCAALVNHGSAAQRAQWLPRLAAGEIACFALTEPDTGSDVAALQTRATRDANGYVLNGTKRFISNAPFATLALILARTSAERLPRNAHISAFLVPMDSIGVQVGPPEAKMGQAGSQIADIILDNVRVPHSALLGDVEGTGFAAAMESLDNGRLSIAATSAGYARRILDTAIAYARSRQAFGEPIANFQLIQAMIADSEAEIYASECMIADACRRIDAGEHVTVQAASAKMFASEACGRIADRCVQIHGGAGYLKAYEAERFFRDSRVYRIYEGTTQVLQLVIARRLLREAAEA
ncbi:acyl-CoA dehydrogenase family protein [Hephaestia sp. GCM10023244]|uniref:acyl-CoA dehydrogenase family protein n=1 Tax=unclassified Hephaestia TaxID=2631281 RepID=UPI002076E908|nr:acyl-CoA dehydrogenase family protein [Hephaestia sp. MAHUQ-44]MCM8731636.1 acyl-CoA dehydrogenase family protein [Hephaestia sp. MAHUQ-44]